MVKCFAGDKEWKLTLVDMLLFQFVREMRQNARRLLLGADHDNNFLAEDGLDAFAKQEVVVGLDCCILKEDKCKVLSNKTALTLLKTQKNGQPASGCQKETYPATPRLLMFLSATK